ncbi:hypothetical protein AB4263_19525 [Vibrio sp. 10N.261.55.C5]
MTKNESSESSESSECTLMKVFITVCSIFTAIITFNASSTEFKYELPIDGEVKEDIILSATDHAGFGVPWSSSFNFTPYEDSKNHFPDKNDPNWPAIHLEDNTYKEIILTNELSGHKMPVYVRVNKTEIQFGTSNYSGTFSLDGSPEKCSYYRSSSAANGTFRVYVPDNGYCKMPSGNGTMRNTLYGMYMRDIGMEMRVPKGRYFSGSYKGDGFFSYGTQGSNSVIVFPANPAFAVVNGEFKFTVDLSVPDRFAVEAETSHLTLQDRLNTWLTTGLAPKTLEAHSSVTFYSNREEFRFWYTCEFKTENGKCAMKNENDDTLELDITFKAPDKLGEISTIQNNNIEIDQEYESHVINEMQSDVLWQHTYLGIKTSPGESERIYENFPGSSYQGKLHIYIDAIL